MNKNCIILEIFLNGNVYPILSDYEGPCSLYTEEEAAAEVDRLIKQRATSWAVMQGVRVGPEHRYQVVTLAP